MRNSLKKILPLLATLMILLGGMVGASGAKGNADATAARAKARHFFLKGSVTEAEGAFDKAFEYYRKAFREDSTYAEAAYSYALSRFSLETDTFAYDDSIERVMELMKRLLDEHPADIQSHETYAMIAVELGRLPDAKEAYLRLVKHHPGLADSYLPLSYVYAQTGNIDSAVYYVREFERLKGSNRETAFRKVSYYLLRGDTLGALAEFDDYVAQNPNNASAWVQRASVYNILQHEDSAVMYMKRAMERFPESEEVRFTMATMHLEKGDTAAFQNMIIDLLKREDLEEDDDFEILKEYLVSLPSDNDYTRSDSLVNAVLGRHPQSIPLILLGSNYDITKKDFNSALKKTELAADIDPSDLYMVGKLISLSVLADQPEIGMKRFEEFDEKETTADLNISLAYITAAEMTKQYDKALAWLGKMLHARDTLLTVTGTLTQEDAERLKENSVDNHDLSVIYEVIGEIDSKEGKNKDVERSFRNALLLDAENTSVLNNLAYFTVETLKAEPGTPAFEEAKEMSRKSIESTEEKPQSIYYDTFAWIHYKEGKYDDAIRYQEIAISLDGDNPQSEIFSHYGDMLLKAGRRAEALDAWKKALELEPDNEKIKKKVETESLQDE